MWEVRVLWCYWGGEEDFYLGEIFPFVGEFNVVVCEGGFDRVYFNMCGCYSL